MSTPDHLATCRAALLLGAVRDARAAVERARREHHMHGGPSPFFAELRVSAAEHGTLRPGLPRGDR